MADKEIKITFSEAKLEALTFFMGQKGRTVEMALVDCINKTYEKYVPTPVQLFMDRNSADGQAETDQQTVSAGAVDSGSETPSRQNPGERRQAAPRANRRSQRNSAQETATAAANSAGQEADLEAAPEQTETTGMTMGM